MGLIAEVDKRYARHRFVGNDHDSVKEVVRIVETGVVARGVRRAFSGGIHFRFRSHSKYWKNP